MNLRHTALLVSVLSLTGCQNLRELTGYSTSNSQSQGTSSSFIPGVSSAPINGKGVSQDLELPAKEKVEICLTTAQVMEKKGAIPEAINYYEQVRQLEPKRDLHCARHLAVLYDRKGDFEKALEEYKKLIDANPKDADAHNDLGYGYYSRGHFETAEKSLRKAVECDPKSKRAWTNLGMALAQVGKYEEAIAAFEKSVGKPQAFCNLGFIQAAQGKFTEAKDSYAMALKMEPGLQKARTALERMNDGPRSKRDREQQEATRRHREMLDGVEKSAARGLPFGMPPGITSNESDMIAQIIDLPPQGIQQQGAVSTTTPPLAPPSNLAGTRPLPSLPQALPTLPSTPLLVD